MVPPIVKRDTVYICSEILVWCDHLWFDMFAFVKPFWSGMNLLFCNPNCNTPKPAMSRTWGIHYIDVIMTSSQITSLAIVYSTVYSDANQRKHQSSASLAFVRGIYRWPVNSPRKGPVTQKMFPFDDVIMRWPSCHSSFPEFCKTRTATIPCTETPTNPAGSWLEEIAVSIVTL